IRRAPNRAVAPMPLMHWPLESATSRTIAYAYAYAYANRASSLTAVLALAPVLAIDGRQHCGSVVDLLTDPLDDVIEREHSLQDALTVDDRDASHVSAFELCQHGLDGLVVERRDQICLHDIAHA